jgi:DnaJ-domain-containing protein 1
VVDFFDIFGLSRNFGIDLSELKGKYLGLMIEYHPDKQLHHNPNSKDGKQRNNNNNNNNNNKHPSPLTAETITHAYQILKTPHTRALHWLEIHGCPLVEERHKGNSNTNDTNNTSGSDTANDIPQDLVGMEFLMEIMEWREAIEDATTNGEPQHQQQSKLEAIAEETKILHRHCEKELEDLLDEDANVDANVDANAIANDEATLQDARQLTAQLQYWHRLETTLKEAMDVA